MKLLKVALLSASIALTTACKTTQETSANTTSASTQQIQNIHNAELYEVHKDNRIYVFYDHSLYEDFLKHGHTAYMYTQIGAGPKGETLVFGLTKEDKKKREGIPSVELLNGSLEASEDFYAEMRLHGRIFVFSHLQDMEAVRKTGEAAYRHAKIGFGPKGETVVFVLNKGNKKAYPEALVKKFNNINSKS